VEPYTGDTIEGTVHDLHLSPTKTRLNMGLLAKRNFRVDEIVFYERPLLILPMGKNIPFSEGLSEEKVIKLHDAKFEETLHKTATLSKFNAQG
jgi:hypothetical protein